MCVSDSASPCRPGAGGGRSSGGSCSCPGPRARLPSRVLSPPRGAGADCGAAGVPGGFEEGLWHRASRPRWKRPPVGGPTAMEAVLGSGELGESGRERQEETFGERALPPLRFSSYLFPKCLDRSVRFQESPRGRDAADAVYVFVSCLFKLSRVGVTASQCSESAFCCHSSIPELRWDPRLCVGAPQAGMVQQLRVRLSALR